MAPRKLSDADKSDIIELYRQPNQTTSTLASQYGVSNSTISRILKLSLPPEEYSELIAQKRMAGSTDKTTPAAKRQSTKAKTTKAKTTGRKVRKRASSKSAKAEETPAVSEAPPEEIEAVQAVETASLKLTPEIKSAEQPDEDTAVETSSAPRRRRRRRKAAGNTDEQLPLLAAGDSSENTDSADEAPTIAPPKLVSVKPDATEAEDEDDEDPLAGLDEALGDALGDDFGDDDLDAEEEDEEDDGEVIDVPKPKLPSKVAMSIMPLGEAMLPKPCYLVVDMRSELITRPLGEFADLGQVPTSDEKAKTLPVFDNHRVARRFSRNKQRVIKVPDGALITRTSPYLAAKGITHLLVDGQVFNLVGV